MEDRDQIRVDLLKFRRKAFLSYPENSPERKLFLKTILENELKIVKQELLEESSNTIFNDQNGLVQEHLKYSLLFLAGAVVFLGMGFHYFPAHWVLSILSYLVGNVFVWMFSIHSTSFFHYRKSIQKELTYRKDIKSYAEKITKKLDHLNKSYGF